MSFTPEMEKKSYLTYEFQCGDGKGRLTDMSFTLKIEKKGLLTY